MRGLSIRMQRDRREYGGGAQFNTYNNTVNLGTMQNVSIGSPVSVTAPWTYVAAIRLYGAPTLNSMQWVVWANFYPTTANALSFRVALTLTGGIYSANVALYTTNAGSASTTCTSTVLGYKLGDLLIISLHWNGTQASVGMVASKSNYSTPTNTAPYGTFGQVSNNIIVGAPAGQTWTGRTIVWDILVQGRDLTVEDLVRIYNHGRGSHWLELTYPGLTILWLHEYDDPVGSLTAHDSGPSATPGVVPSGLYWQYNAGTAVFVSTP